MRFPATMIGTTASSSFLRCSAGGSTFISVVAYAPATKLLRSSTFTYVVDLGMDSQLDDDMDQPQKDYFVAIAKGMGANSNIILCGPEPGWLYTRVVGNGSPQDYGLPSLDSHQSLSGRSDSSRDLRRYASLQPLRGR